MAASKSSGRKRQYAALQPRTLNVAQSAIRKKWTKLPETSQLQVKQLLRSIERSIQHRDGRAAVDIQSVVGNVATDLTRKLPRMPFPPRTEDAFFDYEATLNRTRALEAQLTADVNSESLLKAEIEKERRLLEEDKKELQQLERALKDEEARRQRHSKGLHPLAKSLEQDVTGRRPMDEKPEIACKDSGPLFRELKNDASLVTLLEQLHSHLGSMHNNTASIAEIPYTMAASQAALDSFTWRFFDRDKHGKLHGFDLT